MNTQSARATSSPIAFRQVTLADRDIFERFVQSSECRNCDMSFANIFCWQDSYHSQIAVWNDFLLIRFTTDNGYTAYMQPVGNGNRAEVIEALAADAEIENAQSNAAVEALGEKVSGVEGNRENIKITTPFDMLVAKTLIECWTSQQGI